MSIAARVKRECSARRSFLFSVRAAGAATLVAASSMPATAQCAMCGLSNNGASSRAAFYHGALVLLVPVGAILGGICWLTWKLRDFNSR